MTSLIFLTTGDLLLSIHVYLWKLCNFYSKCFFEQCCQESPRTKPSRVHEQQSPLRLSKSS
ncbi:hypothetical protein SDJN02_27699, partial [Cucurbita argyrosperma subsp. argyrosperma]